MDLAALGQNAPTEPNQTALQKLGSLLSQTWPARMGRGMLSALALPGDVYQGNVSMYGADGHTNPEVINRSADLAGLVMGGGLPMAERGAVGMAGGKLALPMDDASRLARAKAQGYNIDEPVYHETNKQFNEFKPEYGTQVWFTTDKNTLGQNGAAGQGRVIEAFLNNKKLAGWDEYDKFGTDELIRKGYDGARLGSDIVTFNPKGIRSVDAKFDPAKVKSGNILAGMASILGLPVVGAEMNDAIAHKK